MKKIIGFIVILLMPMTSLGYEVTVHKEITKYAIALSSIEQYLLNDLGIILTQNKFKSNIFLSETARNWIIDGSNWEDNDVTQSWLNHFYDPTTGLGLNGSGITWGQPSLVWGKDYYGNLWNWYSTRNAFYNALTNSSPDLREFYFAKLFRGLGQVMHLVQDLAVPAHVRNDPHGAPIVQYDMYEAYTLNNVNLLNYNGYPAVDLTTFSIFDSFWKNGGKGLAEFTNNNFVSRDTNFDDLAYGNYQNPGSIGIWTTREAVIDPWMGAMDFEVKYVQGYVTDNYHPELSSPIVRLAAFSYFDFEVQKYGYTQRVFSLNDKIHKEYSDFLLPRAVGYSAGLLNYFFRGTLEISTPDQNVYAVTDGSVTPYTDAHGHQHQEFTKIKAKVRNTTQNETAGAGTLQAVAMYKMRIDYQPDLSGDPTDEHPEWGVSEDNFSYSVSAPITIASLDSSQSVEFTFDFAASPIPAGVTDLYLQVVFRGTIGNEAANAIAVGMKDLAEPAHHVFWNLSDQFSLGSEVTSTMVYYHLYTENIISTTATLRNMVDLKPTGQPNGVLNEPGEPYIRPFTMTFEIAYINETNQTTTPLPVARVGNLPAGQYIRLVMIQDREQPRIVRFSYSDQIDPGIIGISDQQFPEVINQTEPDGYYYYMPVETFRHGSSDDPIRHHFYTGILRCYPMLSGDYCPYNETESIPVELNPYPSEILFDN